VKRQAGCSEEEAGMSRVYRGGSGLGPRRNACEQGHRTGLCQAIRWREGSPPNRGRGPRPQVVHPGDSCPQDVQRRNSRPRSTCRTGSCPFSPHMAVATDRDARVHRLTSAPSEFALPLMTCDAACARLVDIARVSCSGATYWTPALVAGFRSGPVAALHIKRRAKHGRTRPSVENTWG
jgi:hypothetical protein